MKYLKKFENYNLSSEYPGMFTPEKEEDKPQPVPGFEFGTIDPEDDYINDLETDFPGKNQKEQYEIFKKVTKERNFKETQTEIKINIKKLYHDFYMTIYNPNKYYKDFLYHELMGKYISDGLFDIMTDKEYSGVVKSIFYQFDDCNTLVSVELENIPDLQLDNSLCSEIITIDKLKTTANKFNL